MANQAARLDDTAEPAPRPSVSPIQRAFLALESLAEGARSASDIARVLGVNRSSALRLLQELEATGYVMRDGRSKEYATVPARFYSLIVSHNDHADWSEQVDPVLRDLRDEFGEATMMGVPANGAMVYLAFFPSTHLVAVRERLGTVRPMHASSLGKAYLSVLDERALDIELARIQFVGGTAKAARGPMQLREKLERTRARGYAIDLDETFEGVTCVAAPLWIGTSVIGAIGVSGPSSRYDEARIAEVGERIVEVVRPLGGPGR
ncbi:MAG: IclR family transcriptional regulator [Candidatus Limnocylindrales bacterium]